MKIKILIKLSFLTSNRNIKSITRISVLSSLNKYQRYNHFAYTWQLNRKDSLYNNCIKYKNNFQMIIIKCLKHIFYQQIKKYLF
jgi:hypothetical protein